MTWHLVLATIHANTTLWIIKRLRWLGVDPVDLVSSLRLLISQRLIKKICSCRKKIKSELLKKYYINYLKKFKSIREKVDKKIWEENICDLKAVWCEKCVWGYNWRTVISEVVYVNDELWGVILDSESYQKMKDTMNMMKLILLSEKELENNKMIEQTQVFNQNSIKFYVSIPFCITTVGS